MGFIIVLVVIVVIAVAIFGHLAEKKRREAMAVWAASHGWAFDASKDHSFDERFPAFKKWFKIGSNRFAYNIAQGEFEGRWAMTFDYHYETHSTDSKGHRQTHHHRFSAAILRANIPLKALVIRPEGMFDKLKGAFGYDDIDFESAEFSRRFHVGADDRKWAYDVLHARAIQWLLGQGDRYTIAFDHQHVFVSLGKKRWDPPQFEQSIRVIDELLDMLPDYVKQQQLEQV